MSPTRVRLIIAGIFLTLAALIVAGHFLGHRRAVRATVPPTGNVVLVECNGTPQTGSLYVRLPIASKFVPDGTHVIDCGADGTYRARLVTAQGTEVTVAISRADYQACVPSYAVLTLYPACTRTGRRVA